MLAHLASAANGAHLGNPARAANKARLVKRASAASPEPWYTRHIGRSWCTG